LLRAFVAAASLPKRRVAKKKASAQESAGLNVVSRLIPRRSQLSLARPVPKHQFLDERRTLLQRTRRALRLTPPPGRVREHPAALLRGRHLSTGEKRKGQSRLHGRSLTSAVMRRAAGTAGSAPACLTASRKTLMFCVTPATPSPSTLPLAKGLREKSQDPLRRALRAMVKSAPRWSI
jgi:hypothetical protein